MTWMIGIDVGGTFTDLYAFDAERGVARVHKVPSTPDDPAEAIVQGIKALCAANAIAPTAIARLGHGTTVATNALIQRRPVAIALITTEGFRDLVEIGRQVRPKMFDWRVDYPPPLVPRHLRFEVAERIGAKAQVVTPLSPEAAAGATAAVAEAKVDCCAVCLLFAFLNPEHERRIGAALVRANPKLFVSLSSEVQPEFREYERFSTTVLNAYLQPMIGRYMENLRRELAVLAPRAHVGINQSSGGLMSVERAGRFPIRTALSGPAAGAVGAIHLARLSGFPDVITLDMGGTSADVALIKKGEAGIAFDRDVGGFPIRLPMVDINSIGAGGGSIAWFDRDGLLKVGPLSAGAKPGPACYGLGGDQATVTDANLVLGRLSPKGLLGGRMGLDADQARQAIRPIGERLGFALERAAHGILGIVTANMVRAIRAVSVERGHDPRDFVLMPFGGAGPLHGSDVARSLGIRRMLVPQAPGILCAQGLVVSDLKEDRVATVRIRLEDGSRPAVEAAIDRLVGETGAWFAEEEIAPADRTLQLFLDMRYVGQNFELRISAGAAQGAAARPSLPESPRLKELFFAAHEANYGYFNPEDALEIVNVRLTAKGRVAKPPAPTGASNVAKPPRPAETRPVYFETDAPLATPVYDRAGLAPGHRIEGPAVIDQMDATTLIFPGDVATVDSAFNLVVELVP